jgi:hypothetical protein
MMDSDDSHHSEKKAPQLLEDDVDVAAFVATPEARLDLQVAARLRFVKVASQLHGDLTPLGNRRKIDWNLMPLMCRKSQRLYYITGLKEYPWVSYVSVSNVLIGMVL